MHFNPKSSAVPLYHDDPRLSLFLDDYGSYFCFVAPLQAAKFKWRALRHTCLLLLSILGGMPASHEGMQAILFVVDIYIKLH